MRTKLFIAILVLAGLGIVAGAGSFLPFVGLNRAVQSNTLPLRSRWVYRAVNTVRSPPVIANGLVLVRTSAGLVAVRAADGQQAWFHTAGSGETPDDLVLAQDKTIIIRSGMNWSLDALSQETGRVLWQSPGNLFDGTITEAAIDAERVYVARGRAGMIWAYSLQDGTLAWRSPQLYSSFIALVPRSDGLALFNGASLWILDQATGQVKKRVDNQLEGSQPTLVGNRVLQSSRRALVARDVETGQVLWQVPRNTLDYLGYFDVVGDRIFATDGCCTLMALGLETGDLRWRQEYAKPIAAAPVVIGNTGYLLLTDASIHSFDMASGKEQGTLQTTPAATGPFYLDKGLATDGTSLYVTFGDNTLIALSP